MLVGNKTDLTEKRYIANICILFGLLSFDQCVAHCIFSFLNKVHVTKKRVYVYSVYIYCICCAVPRVYVFHKEYSHFWTSSQAQLVCDEGRTNFKSSLQVSS